MLIRTMHTANMAVTRENAPCSVCGKLYHVNASTGFIRKHYTGANGRSPLCEGSYKPPAREKTR